MDTGGDIAVIILGGFCLAAFGGWLLRYYPDAGLAVAAVGGGFAALLLLLAGLKPDLV
jgi:hypothetical protein